MRFARWFWLLAASLAVGAILIAALWNQDPNSVSEESFGSLIYERPARASISRSEFMARFHTAESNLAAALGPLNGKVQVIVADKVFDTSTTTQGSSGESTAPKLIRARIEYSSAAGHMSRITFEASSVDDALITVALTRLRLLELSKRSDAAEVVIGNKNEWIQDGVGYYVADPEARAYRQAFDVWGNVTSVSGSERRDLSEKMDALGISRVRGYLVVNYLYKVKGWDLAKISASKDEEVLKVMLDDKMLREKYDWTERGVSTLAFYAWPKIREASGIK